MLAPELKKVNVIIKKTKINFKKCLWSMFIFYIWIIISGLKAQKETGIRIILSGASAEVENQRPFPENVEHPRVSPGDVENSWLSPENVEHSIVSPEAVEHPGHSPENGKHSRHSQENDKNRQSEKKKVMFASF